VKDVFKDGGSVIGNDSTEWTMKVELLDALILPLEKPQKAEIFCIPVKCQASNIGTFISQNLSHSRNGLNNRIRCMPLDRWQNYYRKSLLPWIESRQIEYKRKLRDAICRITEKTNECIRVICQDIDGVRIEKQRFRQPSDSANARVNKDVGFIRHGIDCQAGSGV
jgi:hypothetical protein